MSDPADKPPPAGSPEPGSRRALGALVVVGSAAYAAAVALPAGRFITGTAAADTGHERWKRVIELAALPEGTPTRVRVRGDLRDSFTIMRDQTLGSVWLLKNGGSLRALSAECPHLGCAVDIGADSHSFACPCHTSRFTLEGKVEGGPSPRGMDELASRVVDGWVEVELRRYRQGIPDKVQIT
jgi:menaquinol-cytochrome c reductase iron-sulfur subunit